MMETPDSTPWEVLLEAVEEIAAGPEPSPEGLAERLGAGDVAPLLADVDIRFGARSGIVVLKLAPSADLEDLPVFVDVGSWETILERIHLAGSYRGSPVVRITGRGRLKRRRGRNPSIPGAPKQRYAALVVASLDEARVEGER